MSRLIDAPRDLVWEAMTKPEHVVHWWGPNGFTNTLEKLDFRVGGEWHHVMHGPDGRDYPSRGVYTAIRNMAVEKIGAIEGGNQTLARLANYVIKI